MFTFFDEAPTSTSLLMQCGYRSKVCTNHRATKLDGTLHKLCDFHRRKANLNQQRLHERQREKRARLQAQQQSPVKPELAEQHRPTKKARPSPEPIVDSALRSPTDVYNYPNECESTYPTQYTPLVDAGELTYFPKFGSTDMDILELLLLDMQPQPLPLLETFLPSASVDNKDSIAL